MSSFRIPELEELPFAERKAAWTYAYLKLLRHWQVYVGFCVVGLCIGLGFWFGDLIGAGVGGGIGGAILTQITTALGRPYVIEWCRQNRGG